VHDVLTFSDPEAIAETAAEIVIAAASAAVQTRGRFTVALTGGDTVRRLYSLLAEPDYSSRLAWNRTAVLFTDELCVPPDDLESNYCLARKSLLDKVPVSSESVHRIRAEISNPSRAAHFYEQTLREVFPGTDAPRFDLLLLEVGADGHTASLFPGTDALEDQEKWVTANYVPSLGSWRITLTLPALCAASQILFLISGAGKAAIAAEAFGGLPHDSLHPCELVVPTDGQCEVLLDLSAAAGFPSQV